MVSSISAQDFANDESRFFAVVNGFKVSNQVATFAFGKHALFVTIGVVGHNQLDLVDSIWNTHEQFKSVGSAVYNTLAPTLEACYLPRSASPYYAESSGCESLNRAYSALVLGQSTKRNGGDWATSNAHRHVPKHELIGADIRRRH